MKENNFSDTLVEEYDLFGKVFPHHDELQGAVPTELKKYFGNTDGEALTFLDIGAGYGFTTKLVAKEFPKAKYILNEFDAELLSRADNYLSAYNYEKRVGDIEEKIKEIPDASLDAIYTAWVLHNFSPEKRATVFRDIARVLKPNGVFINLDKVENLGEERTKDLAQYLIDLTPFVTVHKRPDLLVEWTKHHVRDEEAERVFTDDEQEKLFRDNGFEWKYVKKILLEKVVVAVKK